MSVTQGSHTIRVECYYLQHECNRQFLDILIIEKMLIYSQILKD
jgi:hypothetical protein